jgi:hypothetical protein
VTYIKSNSVRVLGNKRSAVCVEPHTLREQFNKRSAVCVEPHTLREQFNKSAAVDKTFRSPDGTGVNGVVGTMSFWWVTFEGKLATSRWKLCPTWSTADLSIGGPQRL